jgi:hypothetical protein
MHRDQEAIDGFGTNVRRVRDPPLEDERRLAVERLVNVEHVTAKRE